MGTLSSDESSSSSHVSIVLSSCEPDIWLSRLPKAFLASDVSFSVVFFTMAAYGPSLVESASFIGLPLLGGDSSDSINR